MSNVTRIGLNTKIPENYCFYCPVCKLHLTVTNPVDITDRVSPSLLRGLRAGKLIDIDKKIDIEKGEFYTKEEFAKNVTPKKVEVIPPEVETENAEQEKKTAARTKKATAKTTK